MLIHPRVDGGIVFLSAIESQQFRIHRRHPFAFGFMLLGFPARTTIVADSELR
jgi:hypothetical protein